MKELEVFREIGLNMNESKVYSKLVRHGKLSASEISSKAEVPYGKIYVVLQSLIDKGFVRVVPEKTKKFVASDPKNLEKAIEEKKKSLDEAKKKVREFKQFYEDKDKDFLMVGRGDKGFWKIIEDMSEAKKYGYSIRWDSKVRPGAISRTREWNRKNKNVDVRVLARVDRETESNVKKWLKVRPEMRKMENEGVAMSFSDDNEVMISLIKKNTTLLIRDEAFCKVMKKLFLAAYEKAEKVD